MKKLVFLHGANVSEFEAGLWGDQLFKRLWHTGCNVDFYNVDWRSDIGGDANYHENVSNAFVVASRMAPTINAIPGEKIIMAHSLGNMVVSSMIQDYGLTNDIQHIVCNSAVPSEAYVEDGDLSMRTMGLANPDWKEYPTNSWGACWHTLFKDDPNDNRKYTGRPGRFANVPRPNDTNLEDLDEFTRSREGKKRASRIRGTRRSSPASAMPGRAFRDAREVPCSRRQYCGWDAWDGDRVYISDTQYFDNAPVEARKQAIGGCRPAEERLKDRKGRALAQDDPRRYQRIILALAKTRETMNGPE